MSKLFYIAFLIAFISIPVTARDLEDRTNHVFGFIETQDKVDETTRKKRFLRIIDANQISSDKRLKRPSKVNKEHHRLKITLDRLEVSDFPGWGNLSLLFVFSAQDQASIDGQSLDKAQLDALGAAAEKFAPEGKVSDELKKFFEYKSLFSGSQTMAQPVKYTHLYKIREGDGLGINGYPVFVGLRSGEEGPAFRVTIINVENDDDLDLVKKVTDKVSKGLKLTGAAGTILSVVTGQVEGMVEHIKKRNENRVVQDVFLGLDHSTVSTRAKLAVGSYVVVQIDKDPVKWDWDDYEYDTHNGQVVLKESLRKTKKQIKKPNMDYNYFIIGVSEMVDPKPKP